MVTVSSAPTITFATFGLGYLAIIGMMRGGFPDVQWTLEQMVTEGDTVAVGQVVCIVEAMKMENEVHAHRAGTVSELSVVPGQPVTTGQVICVVTAE